MPNWTDRDTSRPKPVLTPPPSGIPIIVGIMFALVTLSGMVDDDNRGFYLLLVVIVVIALVLGRWLKYE
jgi:type III secretory pathway component EscS